MNLFPIVVFGVGALLAYSGWHGVSPIQTVKDALHGKAPTPTDEAGIGSAIGKGATDPAVIDPPGGHQSGAGDGKQTGQDNSASDDTSNWSGT